MNKYEAIAKANRLDATMFLLQGEYYLSGISQTYQPKQDRPKSYKKNNLEKLSFSSPKTGI